MLPPGADGYRGANGNEADLLRKMKLLQPFIPFFATMILTGQP